MEIPDYFEKIGFHFPPYQSNLPDDVWLHNYIFRDKDWRSQRILHPRVEGGKAVEIGLVHYATNEQDEAAAIQVALKQFRKAKIHYSSGTWKDSYERMIDEIPLVVLQGISGLKKINFFDTEANTQEDCELQLPGVKAPTTGYSDLINEKYVIEIKTKWRKDPPTNADGTPQLYKKNPKGKKDMVGKPKPGDTGSIKLSNDWLRQVSFYSKATNKEPIILCVNDQQCRIFRYLPDDKQNPDHCQSLSPVKVDLFLKQFQIIQQVRQNWLQMSTNPYQLAKIITPDFSSFYWNDLDEDEFEEAVGLWKNI